MAYMVAGYLIIWAASFVLIFSMVQRQRGLQRDVEQLKELAGDRRADG
jgi:CcmD family protein